jgi:hypothetical protein
MSRPVRRFEIRSVVKTTDECVNSNVDGAFDIAVATQGKIGEPAVFSGGHAKLHRRARSCHRQIKRVLKLDLLRLCQTESAGDVGKWFLSKDDRRGTHRANLADELNVFDRFSE